jgi:hypothetical protein
MREQSINRGCMARLGCLLPAPMASWAGSGPKGWHSRSAGAGLVPGSGLPKRPKPSLPASTLASPPLPSTPLHSPPLHSTAAPLLFPTSRCHDHLLHRCTFSSFQHLHLHLHIPKQNPHLYEIDACYAGGPRSQQFLIQLFARTPIRARR